MTSDPARQRLEFACKHYCDWYDGKVSSDAGDVAYLLVSEIRQALALLAAPPEPALSREHDATCAVWCRKPHMTFDPARCDCGAATHSPAAPGLREALTHAVMDAADSAYCVAANHARRCGEPPDRCEWAGLQEWQTVIVAATRAARPAETPTLREFRDFLEQRRDETFRHRNNDDNVAYTPYRAMLAEFYRRWPEMLEGRASWNESLPPAVAPTREQTESDHRPSADTFGGTRFDGAKPDVSQSLQPSGDEPGRIPSAPRRRACECDFPDPVQQADAKFYCHRCSFETGARPTGLEPRRAPAVAPAPSGWQPIETAPECQRVLVCWIDKPDWSAVVAAKHDGQFADEDDSTYRPPTHWQPLPLPPAASSPTERT